MHKSKLCPHVVFCRCWNYEAPPALWCAVVAASFERLRCHLQKQRPTAQRYKSYQLGIQLWSSQTKATLPMIPVALAITKPPNVHLPSTHPTRKKTGERRKLELKVVFFLRLTEVPCFIGLVKINFNGKKSNPTTNYSFFKLQIHEFHKFHVLI